MLTPGNETNTNYLLFILLRTTNINPLLIYSTIEHSIIVVCTIKHNTVKIQESETTTKYRQHTFKKLTSCFQ